MTRAVPFVDGVAVALQLLRDGLPALRTGQPAANVYESLPDHLLELLPAVVIQRTAGASDAPRFHSRFWLHWQCWSNAETGASPKDCFQAAFVLSQQVARVLYEAWESQTVTSYGSIQRFRESSGGTRFTDPDQPHIGRYDGVIELRIRNPRPV